jgi:integrase
MAGLGKQAKVLTKRQFATVLATVEGSLYPARNRVILLLSFKAGLRAKEIATLRWRHVCDAEGVVADSLSVENVGSKGKTGGRTIAMNRELSAALRVLAEQTAPDMDTPVVVTERTQTGVTSQVIINLFARWYRAAGLRGASSHSGRRTFITRAAKNCIAAGGSLRDVQQLAGHASLSMTQTYIEGSSSAKKKIVDMV